MSIYAARDVVNAKDIRDVLRERSMHRNDSSVIQAWLLNHFFRWIVGNFPHGILISSLESWHRFFPEREPAKWFLEKLADPHHLPIFFIDPHHDEILQLEKKLAEFLYVKEVLGLQKKLSRITTEQALAMWERDHELMLKRRRQTNDLQSGLGLKQILTTAEGEFVEILGATMNLREELAYESMHMQHCLGNFDDLTKFRGGYGEMYAKQMELGALRIFSLRDRKNLPHVTISLLQTPFRLEIDQIKGKQNRVPISKYRSSVLALLNHLQVSVAFHPDAIALGILGLRTPDQQGIYFECFENVPEPQRSFMLAHQPHLLGLIDKPTISQQWIAHAGGLSQQSAEGCDPIVRYALNPTRPLLTRTRLFFLYVDDYLRRWSLAVGNILFQQLNLPLNPSQLRIDEGGFNFLGLRQKIESDIGLRPSCQGAERSTRIDDFKQSCFEVELFFDSQTFSMGILQHQSAFDFLAYYAARLVVVIRVLFTAGDLSELEAWTLLRINAQRVQDCFDSWDHFGQSYARGRKMYLQIGQNSSTSKRVPEDENPNYLTTFFLHWKYSPWRRFRLIDFNEINEPSFKIYQ